MYSYASRRSDRTTSVRIFARQHAETQSVLSVDAGPLPAEAAAGERAKVAAVVRPTAAESLSGGATG